MRKLTGILAIAVLLSAQTLFAQGWGTITGRIVVDGDVPKLADLVAAGNALGVKAVPNEKIIIGEKGGLANCFVYLYQRKGIPDIHPTLAKPLKPKIKFIQKDYRFIPHSLVVRTNQIVNCITADGRRYNIHTFPLRNAGSALLVSNRKKEFEHEFPKAEPLPMQVRCDIHPWMTANWFIVDHPYAVVTDKEGKFRINLIPEGKHKFRIWHEVPGYFKKDGDRDIKLEIQAGKIINLGDIKIPADDLVGD